MPCGLCGRKVVVIRGKESKDVPLFYWLPVDLTKYNFTKRLATALLFLDKWTETE